MVEAIPLPAKMALPKIYRSLHSSRDVEAVEAFLLYYNGCLCFLDELLPLIYIFALLFPSVIE
jgi:hypothetical protein